MSEINHETELQPKPDKTKEEKLAIELSEAYARVFLGTPDGRLVLKDLRRKCNLRAPVFLPNQQGIYDPLAAAQRDGERSLMFYIEGSLCLARPKDPDVQAEVI